MWENLSTWADVDVDLAQLRGSESQALSQSVPPCLCDLFAIPPVLSADASAQGAESNAQERRCVSVFAITSQVSDTSSSRAASRVTVQVSLVSAPDAPVSASRTSANPPAPVLILDIEVPGYDVQKSGLFRQVLVCASGRGLLLFCPGCVAGVSVPDFNGDHNSPTTLRSVPLVPPKELELVKVLWHPVSDAHMGVLLSDGSWQLLNLVRQADLLQPEVHFAVTFGEECEPGERVADFVFGTPWASPSWQMTSGGGAGEAAWLAVAVLFLSTRGRLSIRSPVLPSLSVFPRSALDALGSTESSSNHRVREDSGSVAPGGMAAQEWLHGTLLCSAGQRPVNLPGAANGEFVSIRHPWHKHGDCQAYENCWTPVEQVVVEERVEREASTPRSDSPQHADGVYCSLHLVAHSPVAVVARSTTTGRVEVLVLSGALAPKFEPRFDGPKAAASTADRLSSTVFDEIDLVLSSPKPQPVSLSGVPAPKGSSGPVPIVARTRGMIAVIELPWLGSLLRGTGSPVDSLPPASVTTVPEVRGAEGPCEIVGWQLLLPVSTSGSCLGLSLRARDKLGASSAAVAAGDASPAVAGCSAQCVDIHEVLKSASKVRSQRDGGVSTSGSAASSQSAVASGTPAHSSGYDEYLQNLRRPLLLPPPLIGAYGTAASAVDAPSADSLATAVADVQGGQVAELYARQLVLKHLVEQVPVRAASAQHELSELRKTNEELRRAAAETKRNVETIHKRQRDLEAKHEQLVSGLRAELELRALNGVAAEEFPRLWAQLHDLRQAFEVLRATAAPAANLPHEISGQGVEWFDQAAQLQQAWTEPTVDHLRAQALEAEAAVAAAMRAAVDRRRGVAAVC